MASVWNEVDQMKKRIVSLLLTLVMALALFPAAVAAEPALSGSLGDEGQLTWQVEEGVLSIQSDQPWTGRVMAACYRGGRFTKAVVLTPDRPAAQVGSQVGLVKLFWLGAETLAPQCESVRTVLAPDKVFVDGVDHWGDLTYRKSDHFVAESLAPVCVYSLNGVDTEMEYYLQPTAFVDAIAKRGAVSQFFVDEQGRIYRMACFDYTVAKLTGDPATRTAEGVLQVRLPGIVNSWTAAELVTGYEGLAAGDVVLYYTTALSGGGVRYTLERPSKKITGQVSAFNTRGILHINGEEYQATELTVEGCALPISKEAFANWAFEGGSLSTTYDFYLDPSGSICWIDQWEDAPYALCIVLSAQLSGDRLQAEILTTGGTVKTIPVTRLAGRTVLAGHADGAFVGGGGVASTLANSSPISTTIAQSILNEDAGGAFYLYSRLAAGGYGLVRADENTPAETGFTWGESYVIPPHSPIQADADFTWDTIPCRADGQTRFLVAVGDEGHKEYRSFVGLQFLPNTQASGCALTGADGVAKYVYLDTPYFTIEAPEGCVMVCGNDVCIDPDLSHEDVYQVRIADVNGDLARLPVPFDIANAVASDSMMVDQFADNTYVGKLCRITVLDQNGVALGLEPVDTVDMRSIGWTRIFLADDTSYDYDSKTQFIYMDLGWVEEDGVRAVTLTNCGTFDPEGFYNAVDVSDDPNAGAIYRSVKAAVILTHQGSNTADYVYVVRELW